MRKFLKLVFLAIAAAFLLGGCAALDEERNYPPSTAILIGDVAYQINAARCAQIKGIGEDGALDCYDLNGRQSASVTPVSDWRRNIVKEKMGMEWASPQHQAFLFDFFHGGGMDRTAKGLVGSIQQAYSNYAQVKNLADTLKKSGEIEAERTQLRLKGIQAGLTGGTPAWQAHQVGMVQWHLDNARFFQNQMNKTTSPFLLIPDKN